MRKLLAFAALTIVLLVNGSIFSQSELINVVHCKDGSVFKGVIMSQPEDGLIKFKTTDDIDLFLKTEEIEEITVEKTSPIEDKSTFPTETSEIGICDKAIIDAQANYNKIGVNNAVTWVTTLFTTPLIGLVPASIFSSSPLFDSQLNYPNSQLWENKEYKRCYTNEAMKIKKSTVWNNYVGATVVWVVFTTITATIILQ